MFRKPSNRVRTAGPKKRKCVYCRVTIYNLTRDTCHDCWTAEQMLTNRAALMIGIINRNEDLAEVFMNELLHKLKPEVFEKYLK